MVRGSRYLSRAVQVLYERRLAILLLVILLAGFGVRLLPVRVGAHYWDETVYLQHGEIVAGERPNLYNEFDFRPPLMSIVIGAAFTVHHSLVAAHTLVALLATAGVLLVYLIGRELYTRATGIVAAIIYLLSMEHIRVAHTTLVDGILPTAWLLTAYFLLRASDTQRQRYTALAGICTGMAVLLKFTSLVLFPTAAGLLFLAYCERDDRPVSLRRPGSWIAFIRSRLPWSYAGGFVLALAPYLLWNTAVFGHPLLPFIRGYQYTGAPSPPLTYLQNADLLFPLPFAIGLLLFVPLLRRVQDRDVYYPLVFVLALGIPLQFLFEHKEPRYILPIVPFLALMAARGLTTLRDRLPSPRRLYPALIVGLIAATLLTTPIPALYIYPPITGTLTFSDPADPTYDAAEWINANTDTDATVYGNYELSVLAYYSVRRTVSLPKTTNMTELTDAMDGSGYLQYTDRAPDHFMPPRSRFRSDARFTQVYKSDDTYVFAYDPTALDSPGDRS